MVTSNNLIQQTKKKLFVLFSAPSWFELEQKRELFKYHDFNQPHTFWDFEWYCYISCLKRTPTGNVDIDNITLITLSVPLTISLEKIHNKCLRLSGIIFSLNLCFGAVLVINLLVTAHYITASRPQGELEGGRNVFFAHLGYGTPTSTRHRHWILKQFDPISSPYKDSVDMVNSYITSLVCCF